jgi:hypothetical protein
VLSTNSLDNDTLLMLKSRLADCNSSHDSCAPTRRLVPLPTRLIALDPLPCRNFLDGVVDQKIKRAVFRVSKCKVVTNSPESHGRYAILSYCLGQALPYTTTKSNLQLHEHGIMFDSLPRTLQDAVMIAQYLGFDYIWIDCLCILPR